MVYKKYNDFELVYMVQENDDDSYDVLLKKYIPIIKRIAIDYYRSYSHYGYDIDDFLQEAYLSFHKAIYNYDDNRDSIPYSFIVLCLHRALISFCRKITSDKKNISNEYLIDSDSIPLADNSIDIDNDIINRELLKEIWNVVYDFPIEYTCVFELRCNQFKFEEIGKLLDIPVKRVQLMNQRIRKRLIEVINY